MSRADMEFAAPRRHTLQAAGELPEELSASCGAGGARLAMRVDQTPDFIAASAHPISARAQFSSENQRGCLSASEVNASA